MKIYPVPFNREERHQYKVLKALFLSSIFIDIPWSGIRDLSQRTMSSHYIDCMTTTFFNRKGSRRSNPAL